jgi:hypothetical protein
MSRSGHASPVFQLDAKDDRDERITLEPFPDAVEL